MAARKTVAFLEDKIERLRLALQKIADLPPGECGKDPVVMGTHLNMAIYYATNALKN